ncbi:hypothetical protein [uncultured Clostridium sp.]|uniref:hypothetical protein n=1 Tax=uncultured Clostridium sp. TaxID=59620 RepID=UPI0028EAD8BA|nr:hypothetical protein [uncultured Clostridium sp.]
MDSVKNLITTAIENNIIYVMGCVIIGIIGIKITKKLIRLLMGFIFLAYTLFKFAISNHLINLTTIIH